MELTPKRKRVKGEFLQGAQGFQIGEKIQSQLTYFKIFKPIFVPTRGVLNYFAFSRARFILTSYLRETAARVEILMMVVMIHEMKKH